MNDSHEKLQLIDIHKSFQLGPVTTEVLRGINLEVKSGDLLSIMGQSGSGKTTLMNIIGLLDRPSAGTYLFNDQDVSKLNDRRISTLRGRRVGFVFQSFQLLPHLTALENVALPLVYQGKTRAHMKRRASEELEKVNMDNRMQHRPNQLSGGQKQRVAIARALVVEPALLLADEPTGALDPGTATDVVELLKRMNAEQGVTIMVITHDAAVAQQCTRQIRIKSGQLYETNRARSVQSAKGFDVEASSTAAFSEQVASA